MLDRKIRADTQTRERERSYDAVKATPGKTARRENKNNEEWKKGE